MNAILQQCVWPALAEPYQQALRDAIVFILSRFEPIGLIASGTIIRGHPDATSDLDIEVIHTQPFRQRLQKWFNGVPAEIFVNPPAKLEQYFDEEQRRGRPVTAHLLATGFVLFASDPIVYQLRERAEQLLREPPAYSEAQLTVARYTAATSYEDALDVVMRDPATATYLLMQAMDEMVRYFFQQRQRAWPRTKEAFAALSDMDAELANAVRKFYEATTLAQRLTLAEAIAARTIGVHGFFEWESAIETVA